MRTLVFSLILAVQPLAMSQALASFELVGTHARAAAQTTDRGKAIHVLVVYDSKIYMGYGDWNDNTGPIDIVSYNPFTDTFLNEFTLQTEAIENYRILSGKLYALSVDPKIDKDYAVGMPWEEKVGANTTHIMDMATLNGTDLWMVGSLDYDGVVWRSTNGGQTWSQSLVMSPITGVAGDFTRFYFVGVLNGKLYVQARDANGPMHPNSKVFDGSNWSDGPSMFPSLWRYGIRPIEYLGKLIYRDKLIYTSLSYLVSFDGTTASYVFTDKVYDVAIGNQGLYILDEFRQVHITTNLVDWTYVVDAPADACSLTVFGNTLYVGTLSSTLHKYEHDTDSTPPSAPTNAQATALSGSQIQVTWNAATDAESGISNYRIYRNSGVLQDVPHTQLDFTDTGLASYTTYTYEISAINGVGLEGSNSTSANATTFDTTPPSVPSNLNAVALSGSQIQITWNAASDAQTGISQYRIYRNSSFLQNVPSTPLSFTDTGLDGFTTYTYEVSAINGEGLEGTKSNSAAATTFDTTPPSVPINLAASPLSSTQIQITWNAALDSESGIAQYRIFRNSSLLNEVPSTQLNFTDSSLAPFTSYTYEVSAVNGAGLEGSKCAFVSATTLDATAPNAPSHVVATALNSFEIEITWNAASDAESGIAQYRLYRNSSWLQDVSHTELSFTDTGLASSTSYSYEISAVNGVGLEGPKSAVSNATTQEAPDTTPPTTPQNLIATAVDGTSIELTWNAATDAESGIASYRIYRNSALLEDISGNELDYLDSGLLPMTTYSYEVMAINGEGLESPKSAPAGATTLDDTPPSAPTNVLAEVLSSSKIEVTWDAALDAQSGIAMYNIYRNGIFAAEVLGSEQVFVDQGLAAGTTYAYQISAINGQAVEGPKSTNVEATTKSAVDTTPPSAPLNLVATALSGTAIDLVWDAATDVESGIAAYRIFRDDAVVADVSGTVLQFVDTGLTPNTAFSYQVMAINGAGLEGNKSATASATTLEDVDTTPPSEPGNLNALLIDEASVELSWDPAVDAESGVVSYMLYRDNVFLEEVPSHTLLFVDTGLKEDTNYAYAVSAVNGSGLEGDNCASVIVVTPAAPEKPPDNPDPTPKDNYKGSTMKGEWGCAATGATNTWTLYCLLFILVRFRQRQRFSCKQAKHHQSC